MRNKLKAPLPLRDILEKALKMPVSGPDESRPGRPADERIQRLKAHWPSLAGSPLASHSAPVRCAGGRLIVEVESSVWASELNFARRALVGKIKALSGWEDLEGIRSQIVTRSAASRGLKTKPLKSFG